MKRRFDLLHPSNGRLREWLDTGAPDGVAVHVEQCDRCADRLEKLDHDDQDGDVASPSSFQQALSSMLRPPDDLGQRVLHGVEVRWRAEQELALLAGLFTIGVETTQLMFADDAPSADGPRSNGHHPDQPETHDEEDPS